MPTRLLDWASNPLIAADFAVAASPGSGFLSDAAGDARRVPLQADKVDALVVAHGVRGRDVIDVKTYVDPFSVAGVGFVRPRSIATRIVAQDGFFSCHSRPTSPWADPISTNPPHSLIKGRYRAFFRRKLFDLGIDPQRVMGGLDGLGQRLAWQVDSGIGLGPIR